MIKSLDICRITDLSFGRVWIGITSNEMDVYLLRKPAQQNLFCFLGRTLKELHVP